MRVVKALGAKALHRLGLVRGPINRNDRVGALHRAWGHVFNSHIPGDYVEFGVYQGASLVESFRQYRAFRRWLDAETVSPEPWRREVARNFLGPEARFIGFDTFAGMPDNDEGQATFAPGTFRADKNSVMRACARAGLRIPQLALNKGLFSEFPPLTEPAAIVNIDCDLYQSTVEALRIVRPALQQGTVVLMDDWNSFAADPDKGGRRAVRESGLVMSPWFAYHYAGMAFLCHLA